LEGCLATAGTSATATTAAIGNEPEKSFGDIWNWYFRGWVYSNSINEDVVALHDLRLEGLLFRTPAYAGACLPQQKLGRNPEINISGFLLSQE
jgi:hypothetical protein